MKLPHHSLIGCLTHISGSQYKKMQHEENDSCATEENNKATNKTAMIRKFSEYTKPLFAEKYSFEVRWLRILVYSR